MEKVKNFVENMLHMQVINSIIVIVISLFIYKIILRFITGRENNNNLKVFKSKKGKTYFKLIKSVIRYVFIIVTILILLQINGVNVSSMLAGVGIIGAIIGFAVQDALKDIIKGFDIISESYYNVGDVIKFKEIEGKVLTIGIKTTKVEDMRTSNIISISNRNIDQVEVVSNLLCIDVSMPYEVNILDAENAITDILDLIKDLDNVEKCEYGGVNNLADSSIKYLIKIRCNPIQKLQIRRNALKCVLLGLEKNNIQVPYNQIVVGDK